MSEHIVTFDLPTLTSTITIIMPRGARIIELEAGKLHAICREGAEDTPRVFYLRGNRELFNGQEGDFLGRVGTQYLFAHWAQSELRQEQAQLAVVRVALADDKNRPDALLALEEISFQDAQPARWTDWEIVQRLKQQREDRE